MEEKINREVNHMILQGIKDIYGAIWGDDGIIFIVMACIFLGFVAATLIMNRWAKKHGVAAKKVNGK